MVLTRSREEEPATTHGDEVGGAASAGNTGEGRIGIDILLILTVHPASHTTSLRFNITWAKALTRQAAQASLQVHVAVHTHEHKSTPEHRV
jgi:hypothetical protein